MKKKSTVRLFSHGQSIEHWIAVGEVKRSNGTYNPYNEISFTDENGNEVVIIGDGHTVIVESIKE